MDAVCGFYFSYCSVCVFCFVLCLGAGSWLEWMSGARGLSIEETVYVCSVCVCVHLCFWSSVACYSLFLELAVFLFFSTEFSPSKGFFMLGFSMGDVGYLPKCPLLALPQAQVVSILFPLFCHLSL